MRKFLLYACVAMLAGAVSSSVEAQGKVVKRDFYEIRPATQQQVRAAKEWMIGLGKQAQQIAPKMRRLETPHFYLFTTFEKPADDKRYRDMVDRMYKKLCEQFKVDPRRVWVDKCPIFAFATARQYVAFLKSLGMDEDVAENTAGLMVGRSDGLVCIVLNASVDEKQFFNTMVHEGTHAFMTRFITARPLPTWVSEGIAEDMCAKVVENSRSWDLWQKATKQVLAGEKKPESIFSGVDLDAFDYGMAHALVRHMIRKDGTAFSKFVRMLKQGESEEKALKAAYNMDRFALIKDWRAHAEKSLEIAEKEAERAEALEAAKKEKAAKAAVKAEKK